MSIELRDISKATLFNRKRTSMFKHLDFWMEDGERVAVLGVKGSGKSLLLALICGAEPVDEGVVECTSRISWPIPSGSFLTPTSSVAANIRFIGRLYGLDLDKFVREVGELAEIESFLNVKLAHCPAFVRGQLLFALGMWFDFDIYLFDERVVAAPKPFAKRATRILRARTPGKGLLLATSSPDLAKQYCDTAFVIDGGRAEHYTDMGAAVKHFSSLNKTLVREAEEEEEEQEMDDQSDM
jgi:capsular polysaccharide transport system ATP-binding protein